LLTFTVTPLPSEAGSSSGASVVRTVDGATTVGFLVDGAFCLRLVGGGVDAPGWSALPLGSAGPDGVVDAPGFALPPLGSADDPEEGAASDEVAERADEGVAVGDAVVAGIGVWFCAGLDRTGTGAAVVGPRELSIATTATMTATSRIAVIVTIRRVWRGDGPSVCAASVMKLFSSIGG